MVYEELHGLASRLLAREQHDVLLQPTALVHEAYLRLAGDAGHQFAGRDHFLAVAARCIPRILIDLARARRTLRRGGSRVTVELMPDHHRVADSVGSTVDLADLADSLEKLSALHERQARVVELRFFAGFDVERTARILGVAPRTVEQDWAVARAWLRQQLRP